MKRPAPAIRKAQEQLLGRAVAQLQQRQLATARVLLDTVLERWPGQPDALQFLGVVHHLQGDGATALGLLRRATEALPDAPGPWNNLGNVLNDLHRFDEAEAAYRRCLALQPGFTDALGNLAALCSRRGARDEAAAWYRRALVQDPDNPQFRHHLAACLDEPPPARASDAYLQQVFDRAAPAFDARLAGLGYQAPQLAVALLQAHLPPPAAQFDIGDLGCGTGLCGPLLRPWARYLAGCDLSPGMLALARARAVYDALSPLELSGFLAQHAGGFDLLICTDTLIYFGTLHPVFAAAARALRAGGWFVFSLEALPDADPAPLRLLPHGRYAHRLEHATAAIEQAGLALTEVRAIQLRQEGDQPVAGWMVLARQPLVAG